VEPISRRIREGNIADWGCGAIDSGAINSPVILKSGETSSRQGTATSPVEIVNDKGLQFAVYGKFLSDVRLHGCEE
jgi:hypothetical protein